MELLHLDRQKVIENEKKRRILIVSIWYVLSLLIALFIPNITFVIRYLGALAAAFMFIFPGKNCLSMIFKVNFHVLLMLLPVCSGRPFGSNLLEKS